METLKAENERLTKLNTESIENKKRFTCEKLKKIGYVYSEYGCLSYHSETKTWADARNECRKLDGDLETVHSVEEVKVSSCIQNFKSIRSMNFEK